MSGFCVHMRMHEVQGVAWWDENKELNFVGMRHITLALLTRGVDGCQVDGNDQHAW